MNQEAMKQLNKELKKIMDESSDEEEIDCHGWITTDGPELYTGEWNYSWVAEKNATWKEFMYEWEQYHLDNWEDIRNEEVRIMIECRDSVRKSGNTLENDKETSMMNNLHDVLSNCISPVTYMKLEQKMRERPNVSIDDYNALVEKAIRLELENKQRAAYIRELQDELIALKKEKMVK